MDKAQRTIVHENDCIRDWFEAFLLDRKVRAVSPGSIRFYHQKLGPFVDWCEPQGVAGVLQLTPNHLRAFLLHLETADNNPGGRHAYYRAIRAFLNFFENEVESQRWRNPIGKVATPKVPERPLDAVPVAEVARLIAVCDPATFYGARDRAIFMLLVRKQGFAPTSF